MKPPKVGPVSKNDKHSITHYARYSLNGRPMYDNLGSAKKTAEKVASQIQGKLVLGKYDISFQPTSIISLENLINEHYNEKRSSIQKSSLSRYNNYARRFIKCFNQCFPGPPSDISLIRTRYIHRFIREGPLVHIQGLRFLYASRKKSDYFS